MLNTSKYFRKICLLTLIIFGFLLHPSIAHAAEPPLFDSYNNMIPYIQSQLADHQTTIKLYYKSEDLAGHIKNRTGKTIVSNDDIISKVYDDDPKNPAAGDYLKKMAAIKDASYSLYSEEDNIVKIVFEVEYVMTKEEESYVSSEINRILSSLSLGSKSDYEKAETIYRYINTNITYKKGTSSPYYALKYHYGNCVAYSSLLYRMLLSVGVGCKIIDGTYNGSPHCWNIIQYDFYWYSTDATIYFDPNKSFMFGSNIGLDRNLFSQDHLSGHTRTNKCATPNFCGTYPMGKPKLCPYTACITMKRTTTIKYNSLKKKKKLIKPLHIYSIAPINCSIVPSKDSKYFTISKYTGVILVNKISKKNKLAETNDTLVNTAKLKKKTYCLTICITTEPTSEYFPSEKIYKTIYIKIK